MIERILAAACLALVCAFSCRFALKAIARRRERLELERSRRRWIHYDRNHNNNESGPRAA